MMDNKVLISIIIPCYNCEAWLKRNFDSLIKQNYKNFEVIFVDDGSKDNSVEIARKILENKKFRYRILTQDNLGVSITRNRAIDECEGEYLYFLDADDYIDDSFCQSIYERYKENDFDMIFFNYAVRSQKDIKYYENKERVNAEGIDILRCLLDDKLKYHMCSFLIKRDIVNKNKIRFVEYCKYGEDHEFIIRCLCKVKKVDVLNKCLFNYCMREDSAVHIFTANRLDSMYAAIRVEEYVNNVSKKGKIENLAKKYVANKILYNLNQVADFAKNNKIDKYVKDKMLKEINKNKRYIKYLDYNEKDLKKKILKIMIMIDLRVYLFIKKLT